MAVEVLYRSSLDPERTFMNRSEADAHDRMLELAESLQSVIQHAVPSITEDQAEELAIFLSKRRDVLAKAFGKSPELLQTQLEGDGDGITPES